MRGWFLADHLEDLAALELAQPAAYQRRQIATAGLTQVDCDICRQCFVICHSVHLPCLSGLRLSPWEARNIAQTSHLAARRADQWISSCSTANNVAATRVPTPTLP